jgi:glutamyl-tRNA reductase
VIANRTADRGEDVVAALPASVAAVARAAPADDLVPLLSAADVVFSTVGVTHPIIDTPMLAAATAERDSAGPLLVVDLGVPRNVEPAAGSLDGVELLDMEDLRAAVSDALSGRREEVTAATEIVAEEVERFRTAARARDAAPIISAMRSRVEEARRAEVGKLRGRRSELTDEQWEQVDAATRAVVAKLLHQPTVALKSAAGTPRGERLTEALRTLFDL